MIIRDINLNDLVKLEKDATFPLPSLDEPLFFIKKSLISDAELLASFWVKLTSETSVILNSKLSDYDKAKALITIEKYLAKEIDYKGIQDNHVFISNNDHYIDILKKHFKYEDIVGHGLVRRK